MSLITFITFAVWAREGYTSPETRSSLLADSLLRLTQERVKVSWHVAVEGQAHPHETGEGVRRSRKLMRRSDEFPSQFYRSGKSGRGSN